MVTIFMSFVFLLLSCEVSRSPLVTSYTEDEFNYVDTTQILFPGNLEIKFESIDTYYSLDDTVFFKLYAINHSRDNYEFQFHSSAYSWTSIYDQFSNHIFSYGGGGPSEGSLQLESGDTLKEMIFWPQTQYSPIQSKFLGLKTNSGWYKLVAHFTGVTEYGHLSNAQLIKWINISEVGNPISFRFNRNWNNVDSLEFNFEARNRLSSAINVEYLEHDPIIVLLIDKTDTLFVRKFQSSSKFQLFSPYSDVLIFSYTIAKNDTILEGLYGHYLMIAQVNFKDRILKSISDCYIYK